MSEMSKQIALDILGWPRVYSTIKKGTLFGREPHAFSYSEEVILEAIKRKFPQVEKIV